MRRIRYQVASSLDGYIADPNGDTDWIVDEPTVDFDALFEQFDTLLMGRRTYEGVRASSNGLWGKQVLVFTRTLRQEDHPAVTLVSGGIARALDELRSRPGKDIWLFGGGVLFRSLLEIGRVDTIELAIIPVLLGGGLPFLAPPAVRRRLTLTARREYPSGIVWLDYDIRPDEGT